MKKYLFTLSMILSLSGHCAGEERDGGNPIGLSSNYIKHYIQNNLKYDVKKLLDEIIVKNIKSYEVKLIILTLLQNQVSKDIDSSKYMFAEQFEEGKCVDSYGNARGATSGRNDFGGDVCFDSKILAEQATTKASLIALTIHEHAHHFGYEDKDNLIGEYFTNYIDFKKDLAPDSSSINDKVRYTIGERLISFPNKVKQKKIILEMISLTHKRAKKESGSMDKKLSLTDNNIKKLIEDTEDIELSQTYFSCKEDSISNCIDSIDNILSLNNQIIDAQVSCQFSGFFSSDKCEVELRFINLSFLKQNETWVIY